MFSSNKILKFLELKNKSIFVKEFLSSTKVKPKRIEHLQEKGIISSEPAFSYYVTSNKIDIIEGAEKDLHSYSKAEIE